MMKWLHRLIGASGTAKMKPASITQRIRRLTWDDSLFDDDEPKLAESTVLQAEQLLNQSSDTISQLGFEDADIHPANGAIRIIWTCDRKTLKLIIPPNGEAYIFHKEGEDYDLCKQVDRESLNHWLNWLYNAETRALSSVHA